MAVLSSHVSNPVRNATAEMLDISFVESTSLEESGPLWRKLEQQWHSTAMSCSWAWITRWIGQFDDQVDWKIVTGEFEGNLIGIALVTASLPFPAPRLGFRGMVHIGTSGERRNDCIFAENNRLLTAPEFETKFAAALVRYLQQRYRPIAIHFVGFPPRALTTVFRDAESRLLVEDMPCPFFDFAAAREQEKDVLGALSSGVRGRIRRSDRGFGELHRDWATNEDEALEIFEEMAELHQARWRRAGKLGSFASEPFTRFHRETIRHAFQTGAPIMLFRLRNDEGTIGCLYGFIEDGELLFYQSGFIETSDNRLKPGLSTHAAGMQECMDRGLTIYNFLAGDSRYKRELSSGEVMLQNVMIFRFAFIPQVINTLIRWGFKDRARSIKHWYQRRSVRQSTASTATRNSD